MARAGGVAAARAALMPIEGDPRVPMMQIYALYKGTGGIDDVLAVAKDDQALFYAHLYLALYYEAAGNPKAVREHIDRAAEYKADNYMADVARVHLKLMKCPGPWPAPRQDQAMPVSRRNLAASSGGVGLMWNPVAHSKPATRVSLGMISMCQW